MARTKAVTGGEEFSALLNNLAGDQVITVMKSACYSGVGVLADAIKSEIRNLPEEDGYMRPGKKRNVIGKHDKRKLEEKLGVSHIEATGDKATVAVSFAGYNDRPTKKYPNGVPIPLIARSIESGSSVRQKNPFIRRAFNNAQTQAQEAAIDAGQKALNELIK
jgi:GGDEF domain-containing protein